MSRRLEASRAYMAYLVQQYEVLEAERARLLAAADRLAEIQAEKADLLADAAEALPKFNALGGTDYTLAQVRELLKGPGTL